MTGTSPRITVTIEPTEAGPGSMFASGRIEPKPATVNHLAPGDRLTVDGVEAIRREEREALKAAGTSFTDGVGGPRMAWARYGEASGDFSKTDFSASRRALEPAPFPVPLKRCPSNAFYVTMPNGKSAKAADAIAAGFIVEGTLAAFQLAEIVQRQNDALFGGPLTTMHRDPAADPYGIGD